MNLQISLLAIAIGVLSGFRSMTPVAAVSWAAQLKWIDLTGSKLAFLGSSITPYILTLLALMELVADKLPFTPNRTSVGPFVGRLLTGSISGAALFAGTKGSAVIGAILGALGAIGGTFGGFEFRKRLTAKLQSPMASAVIEDLITIVGAYLIVASL